MRAAFACRAKDVAFRCGQFGRFLPNGKKGCGVELRVILKLFPRRVERAMFGEGEGGR